MAIVMTDDMQRFLSISLIALVLVMGAAGRAPAAHAQGESYQTAQYTTANTTSAANANAVNNGQTTSPASTAAAGTPTNPNLGGDTASQFGTVMTWIMSLFAWLLGVAALTLNYAVYYTVVTMGKYVNSLSAIGVVWRIMRDLANIMLIFGFIGAGIATILNVEQYGWSTKMLPMLLVAAIFLNFSLFVSEAMVDATNLFATQFMTEINGNVPLTQASLSNITVGTFGSGTLGNEGISNKIMAQLGFQTIFNPNTDAFKGGNTWIIGFMGILLFLVTAFVMFSLAFILIARFVALIFLILLSPVGFMGLAIPQLQYRASQWWRNFLEQIITAPILLLLLYVALAVITDVNFLTGICSSGTCTKNWLGFVSGNDYAGFASMLLSFFVAIGLLLVVVIKAKSMGAVGASWATKGAGKLTFGLTAAGMRSTAGWGFQSASRRFRSSKLARIPVLGRTFAGVLDRGAKASFDVRGITAGGGLTGIGAGTAQKGGYRSQMEEAIKGREGYAKDLTQTPGTILGIRVSEGEAEREKKAKKDLDQAEEDLKKAKAADTAYSTTDTRQALADAARDQRNAQETLNKAKNAPQLGYAKGITWGPGRILYRNTKAADNIKKTAGKSKEEKDVDALMNLLKKTSEKSEKSENAPAAPAAPPASSGAPKP